MIPALDAPGPAPTLPESSRIKSAGVNVHPSFVDFAFLASEPGEAGLRLRPAAHDLFELSLTRGHSRAAFVLLNGAGLAALGRYLANGPYLAGQPGGHFRARAERGGRVLVAFAADGTCQLSLAEPPTDNKLILSVAQAETAARLFQLAAEQSERAPI